MDFRDLSHFIFKGFMPNGNREPSWKPLAEEVVERLGRNNNRNLVHIGFKDAGAMDFFSQNGIYVAGIGISPEAIQLASNAGFRASYAPDIGNLNGAVQGTYAIGFCYNLLPKLSEECIPGFLEEMARVCHWRLYVGISQEASIEKPEAWLERHLLRVFGDDKKWNVKRLDLEWSLGYEISRAKKSATPEDLLKDSQSLR